jgi:hypothetical protein
MIPKKIHYCWLSNDPMPEKLLKCVESWKKYLPDYELIKWDLQRFPLSKNVWVKEAFENKKYAFAADYIRLYALATEGGIYLDSDVEVLKSFDDLLKYPYFICKENSPKGIEAAIIGAEKETPWVLDCLSYYDGKHFIDKDGNAQTDVLPSILKKCILEKHQMKFIDSPSHFVEDKNVVCVLPMDYFSPKNYVTKKICITENTYSIHHFAGTWQPLWKRMLLRIWVPFSVMFPNLANTIKTKIK